MCNKWKICSQFFFLSNQLVMLNIMNLWGTLAMHIFLVFLLLFVYDTFVCIACLALLKQIQYHFTNSSQTLPRYKRSGLYAYSAWTTAFSKRKYNTPSPVTQKWKQLINCIVQIPPHILKQYGTQTQTGKHSFSL